MSALELRLLDRVELHGQIVATFTDGTVNVQVDDSVSSLVMVKPSAVKSIISRAETPEETIARLKAELAKAPRRIEWGGGECPVDCEVIVWFRNGLTKIEEAHSFGWSHADIPENKADDIIAYMVLPS